MSTGEFLWLFCGLLVLALFVAMVWLLWWALFADRANGRRRCPRCWFDMSYSPTTTCSECGFTPRHDQQLYRTRRRYGVAVLAIVGSLIIASAIYVQYDSRGWITMVPARALIVALPWVDDDASKLYDELQRRMIFGQLTQEHWLAFVRRAVKGDGSAEPTTDAWIDKYGGLIWRFRSRFAPGGATAIASPRGTESPLEKKLLDIDPRLEVRTRKLWPADMTPFVNVAIYDWWPYGSQLRITARPQFDGAEPVVFFRAGRRPTRTAFAVPVKGMPRDLEQCEIVFDIARRRPGVLDNWKHTVRARRTVSIKRSGSLKDVITPSDDRELDQAMIRAFALKSQHEREQRGSNNLNIRRTYRTASGYGNVVKWTGGPSPVRFRYNPRPTMATHFTGAAVGVSVKLFHHDQLARQLDMWWKAGAAGFSERGWSVVYEDIDLLLQVNENDHWTLRVTSDPRLALRAGDAETYWEGAFTVPVTVDEHSGAAREPRWWTPELANAPGTDEPSTDKPADTFTPDQ